MARDDYFPQAEGILKLLPSYIRVPHGEDLRPTEREMKYVHEQLEWLRKPTHPNHPLGEP